MLRVWVHSCDPGRVSDGSRLALYQTLSIECPASIFFWHVYFVIVLFLLSFLFCFIVFFFALVGAFSTAWRKEEVDAATHRQEKREATRLGNLLSQTGVWNFANPHPLA